MPLKEKEKKDILIRLTTGQINAFDKQWRAAGYANRTNAIRAILREWTKKNGKVEPTSGQLIQALEQRVSKLENKIFK